MNKKISTTRMCATVIGAFLLTTGIAQAGVGDQLNKLLASDGAFQDDFGIVAISGTNIIVGAQLDDDNGAVSGSAYLFDAATGLETAKLLASDGFDNDRFGDSVGISGNTAIVGAALNSAGGSSAGAAYLYDVTTGMQTFKLVPNDLGPSFGFGTSVAICGTTAIVGAPGDSLLRGSAYLFDTTTGLQTAKLIPSTDGFFARFGYSVAISGTTAIVGTYNGIVSGVNAGTAYLYDTTTGMELARLEASDGAANDSFGWSVAIDGNTAIVGAYLHAGSGVNEGAAYVFDVSTGLQTLKLVPSDVASSDTFGFTVGISGTTAIVGSNGDDDNGSGSGSAYLFDTTTGMQIEKLLPNDGSASDFFGVSVAISGVTAVIGAVKDDDNGTDSGSAYIFQAGEVASLTGDVASISLGTGGSQALALDGGATRAGWAYFMLGSVTGTAPGIDFGGGVVLPLNFDMYMNLILTNPGLGAFGNFSGTLDGTGQAAASLTLPPLMDPSLIGVTMNHAYLSGSIFGLVEFASNAVPVLLAP